MRQGLWEKKKFMGTELYHQTLGIIGLGKIGSIVADRALSMKMEVLVFDPHIVPEMAAVLGAEYVSLDALLARSDFITVHTPLKDDTRGLIGREALAKTKWGVRILNCARGGWGTRRPLRILANGHVGGGAMSSKGTPGRGALSRNGAVFSPPPRGVAPPRRKVRAISFKSPPNTPRASAQRVNFPHSMKEYEESGYLTLAKGLGNCRATMRGPELESSTAARTCKIRSSPSPTVIKGCRPILPKS